LPEINLHQTIGIEILVKKIPSLIMGQRTPDHLSEGMVVTTHRHVSQRQGMYLIEIRRIRGLPTSNVWLNVQ
jgi:hypothetical protein